MPSILIAGHAINWGWMILPSVAVLLFGVWLAYKYGKPEDE